MITMKNLGLILFFTILLSCTSRTVKNNHHNGKANRLINESSPYLQQHAYNPVDWFPWGEEALEKAQAEDFTCC